jgi:hypothetical protein
MATLAGNSIASSYTSLLKLDGNTDSTAAGNGNNAIQVKTGDDDATPLFLNTDRLGIGGHPDTLLHLSATDSAKIRIESTDTTATASQVVGGLEFEGNDSSANANGIRANITATYEDIAGKTKLTFGTADSNASVSDRLTIDGDGNATFNNAVTVKNYIAIYDNDGSTLAGYVGSGQDMAFGDANDLCIRGVDSIKFTANDGNADAMTIDSSGNVGIGATPTLPLTVQGAGGNIANFTNGNNSLVAYVDNSNVQIANNTALNAEKINMSTANNAIEFYQGGSEKMTLTSTGLGIGSGSSSPATPLNVADDGSSNGIMSNQIVRITPADGNNGLNIGSDGTDAMIGVTNNDTDLHFLSRTGGTYSKAMTIDGATGSVGIGSDSPNQFVEIKRASRTTTFDASNSDTWVDVLVRNPQTTANSATGIAFQLDSVYHTNGSTGICAVHGTGQYEADMAFITRGNAVPASEKMRLTSGGSVGIGTASINGAFTVLGTPMTAVGHQTVADIFGNVQQDADKGAGIGLGGRYITDADSVTAFAEILGVKANNTSANYEGEMVFKTRVNGGNQVERMRLDANSRISLSNNDSNVGSTVFGYNALDGNTDNDSDRNTAIGYGALDGIGSTTAVDNIAIGYDAIGGTMTATNSDNVAIGNYSMDAGMTNSNSNVAVGSQAFGSATAITSCVAIGKGAFANVSTIVRGIAIGEGALGGAESADYSVAVGYSSMYNTTGAKNTALGYQSANTVTDGTENTVVGYDADASTSGAVNQTVIGSETTGVADNSVTLGNGDVTAVYMAQDSGATIYASNGVFVDDTSFITVRDSSAYSAGTGGGISFQGLDSTSGTKQFGTIQGYSIGDNNGGVAILTRDSGSNNLAVIVDNNRAVKPGVDDAYDLGTASLRWDDIFASSGTVNSSDERRKENIKETSLGLDFVNKLKPKEYKWKDYDYEHIDRQDGEEPKTIIKTKTFKRKHQGLLAQDVEKTLKDIGLTNNDFAGLIYDKDADMYGIRYHELIAPLIKAVQELSSKVTELENK